MSEARTTNEVNRYVGRRIRQRRRALDITHAVLAAHLDVSESWVSLAESGHRGMSVVRLMAVCAALGVNPADLLPPVVTDA